MKNLIFLFILFASCDYSHPYDSHNISGDIIGGYNIDTDNYINRVMDTEPIIKKCDGRSVFVRYDELQITANYHPAKEYSHKEYWHFYCAKKDGSMVIIQSTTGLSLHNVSKNTLNRIKNLCAEK